MSAGTLTLTNNSDLVSGAGTSFSTELTAGDFVVATVGGVTYTLPVKSVEGDTEITLISKYPGPTQQGSAWNAVPRATQNQVTAALVVQSTEALRGLNYDKQNWQAVFGVDGNITVMLPDGSSFSGPSWLSIANILKTLDVEYLEQLAAQINQDAQQVETDKNTVVETATQVSTDAQAASAAATGAQGSAYDAAESETNAEGYKELARKYALNPEDNPVTGSEYSALHYSEKARKSAAEAASHNPAEALVKSLNLSDLADRAAAWLNVRPIGATPLAGDPVSDYDATTKRWVINYVGNGGGTGPTMNGVQNYGVGERTLWDSRAFIPSWALPQDGQIVNRADWPELWAHAQMHTPIEDATWLANPSQRGMYSRGDGSTTFRMPDLNGVQSGSIRGLYGRGDGGGYYVPGYVFENGAPDITGYGGGVVSYGAGGAFRQNATTRTNLASGSDLGCRTFDFAASWSNSAYGRSPLEIRGNNFAGVWIVRASGGFTAANTLWSVINSDATLPPNGTQVSGGQVISTYKTDHGDQIDASFRVSKTIGNQYTYAVIKASDSAVTSSDFFFGSNGSFIMPNNGIVATNPAGGAIRHECTIKTRGVVTDNGDGVVVLGAEANNLALHSAPAGQTQGNYINLIQGRWYAGNWTLGGVRGSSQDLLRAQLNVTGGSSGLNASFLFGADGVGRAAQWVSSSDRRVKSLWEIIPEPLNVMKSIRGYSWYYEPWGTQGFGFMSDEVEKFFPGAVKEQEGYSVEMPDGSKINNVKSVDTYGIAAALHHEAILAMMDQIEELKAEIKKLKGE
ncbi:hypothetical protein VNX24_24505 [Citrobacter farmeri]|uniref:hypothetical protein n=1 Tax=Citrobacter farmeri TaxID=67824 RepID=UPI0031BBA637